MTKRGSALVLFYFIATTLTVLGAVSLSRSVSETSITEHYTDGVRAFWIADAGMNQAYYNWANAIAQPAGSTNFSGGSYTIDVTNLPLVSVNGSFSGTEMTISAFFMGLPLAFENTLSVGGDLSLLGILARAEVYGRARISGNYTKSGWGASDYFEDLVTGVAQGTTTIPIPDYNINGTGDEFDDFVVFGQNAVGSYEADEVLYIQGDDTVNIFPSQSLEGIKVIFVEGSTPGAGDVNIFFDGTWEEDEDLTIISTGTVTYVQPLQFQEDARLSTVSWDNYNEISIFRSEHESVVYTHDDALFIDILDWGSTTGNIIANGDMSMLEILTYERFYYSARASNGDVPPGMQWLSLTNGNPDLIDWQE